MLPLNAILNQHERVNSSRQRENKMMRINCQVRVKQPLMPYVPLVMGKKYDIWQRRDNIQ